MPPGWAAFLKRSNKSQRLENWGARRAALRPYFFLPPKGWPFGVPGGDWTCSAEVNSACAKGDSAPLYAPPGAPHRRWGPRRERRKMPPGWAAFLKRSNKSQRLENWGARRAAFRPYFFLPPKGWPFGDPFSLDLLGGSEFRLRQGFGHGPNPCTRRWRAPCAMGPLERKKKNAAQ